MGRIAAARFSPRFRGAGGLGWPRLLLTDTCLQRDKLEQRFFMSTPNVGPVPEVFRIGRPSLKPFNYREE